MTLTGSGRRFAAWLTQRHYAPVTVRIYVAYIERAERALGVLDQGVGVDELYDWWTTLPDTAASRNGARKALTAFYRSQGSTSGWPAVELPQWPEQPRPPQPIAETAFGALRAAAAGLGGEHHALAALLATTGCRISEARTARWDAFSFDGDTCTWRINGKGSARRGPKLRDIPLHPSTVTVLTAWRQQCPSRTWVFPSPCAAGRPLADNTMRQRVYDIADAAGVADHVNPHRWRHTAATAALEATRDLAAVQDLLGHQNPATTRRYTLVGRTRMAAAVDGAADYGHRPLHAVS